MDKNTKSQKKTDGTKTLTQNSLMLVSSGIPALDDILGGGLPVGTVTVIEEDIYGTYAKTMLKCFVAEGVVSNHAVFLASQDWNPHHLTRELPSLVEYEVEPPNPHAESKMKIAFRYENLPTNKEDKENAKLGHCFDLTKYMSQVDIENADITYWSGSGIVPSRSSFNKPAYYDLLKQIKTKIKEGQHYLKDSNDRNSICRIAIGSLGSPMWFPTTNSVVLGTEAHKDLEMFVFCLRALVRSAHCVAVITIPSHLHHESTLGRCLYSSDIAIRLQSFAGTELEKNKALSNYHGYFHLTKWAPMNSFVCKHPGSVEFVFKLKRKKFTIEKLHLPPDFEETTERNVSAGCCGTSNLDF